MFSLPSLNRFVFDIAAPDHTCQCARVLDVGFRRLNEVFDFEESEAARMSLIERIRSSSRQLIGADALLLLVIFAGSGVQDRDLIIEPRMNARPHGLAFIRGLLFSAAHADDFQRDSFL